MRAPTLGPPAEAFNDWGFASSEAYPCTVTSPTLSAGSWASSFSGSNRGELRKARSQERGLFAEQPLLKKSDFRSSEEA